MDIQKINADNAQRIETGPLQIGDDWPGVFMRGDESFYYKMMLESLDTDGMNILQKQVIQNLIVLFKSCRLTQEVSFAAGQEETLYYKMTQEEKSNKKNNEI